MRYDPSMGPPPGWNTATGEFDPRLLPRADQPAYWAGAASDPRQILGGGRNTPGGTYIGYNPVFQGGNVGYRGGTMFGVGQRPPGSEMPQGITDDFGPPRTGYRGLSPVTSIGRGGIDFSNFENMRR